MQLGQCDIHIHTPRILCEILFYMLPETKDIFWHYGSHWHIEAPLSLFSFMTWFKILVLDILSHVLEVDVIHFTCRYLIR